MLLMRTKITLFRDYAKYTVIIRRSSIIGKTKSTNFQNEKYKKGMSFKYYINGA